MKKVFSWVLTLMVAITTVGCSSTTSTTYKAGTYTASEQGFGGTVTVSITTTTSKITEVTIIGEDETPEKGGVVMESLQATILEKQSADVDVVTGSTVTSKAVIQAATKAISKAKGEEESVSGEVKMKPGTYASSAYGFFVGCSDKVLVTVDETSIISVEWNPDET